MRRIQQRQPTETTIWVPVSVPIARFTAFEQMVKSVRRRNPRQATRAKWPPHRER